MWALISEARRALAAAPTLVLVGLDRPGGGKLSAAPARGATRRIAMAHIRLIIVLAALLAVPALAAAQQTIALPPTPALPPRPDLPPPSRLAAPAPAPAPPPAPAPSPAPVAPAPSPAPVTTDPTPAQLAAKAAQRRRAAAAARRRAIARRRAAERARRERRRREVLAAAADARNEVSGALTGVTASARQAATAAAVTAIAQAGVMGEDRRLLWMVAVTLDAVFLLGVFAILRRRYRTHRGSARRVGPRRIAGRVGGGASGDQVAVMRDAIGRRRARAAVAIACSRIVKKWRPERRSPPGRLRARAAELGLTAGARAGLAASLAVPLPEADWPLTRDAGPNGAAQAGAWVRAHRLDLCIVGALSLVLGAVHAWGMGRYPAFFDDEGTYVSQAWSIDAFQELSPYTYWYDHPPLGWILLAGWARVVPTFGPDLYSIAAARAFMVLIFVVSACLLYVVARRLGVRRPFAALAVVLFGLSPLAVHYQRMVLLDNIAVCWLLAAFALALSPRRRLWAYAGSGVCLAAASLTKETFVLFAPALALVVWQQSAGRTRRFALAVFGGLLAIVLAFYPLFALLRGELVSGAGHTSLMDGVRFQLMRPGSGSIFDAGSGSRELIDSWLSLDWILLALGLAALPIALVFRQLLPLAIALLIPLAMAARPGTYLPAMFIVGLLPFAALLAGAVADRLWRPQAAQQWLAARGRRRGPVPLRSLASSAAVAAVLVALAFVVPLRWSTALATQTGTDLNQPYRQTIAWLEANADRDSTILVDNTIWTDLVHRGFTRARTVWFYKLDLDPEIRIARQEFDYIVRTNLFAGNLDDLPRSRELFETSVPVARFSAGHETIEIRRVHHAGAAPQAPAEKRGGAGGRG